VGSIGIQEVAGKLHQLAKFHRRGEDRWSKDDNSNTETAGKAVGCQKRMDLIPGEETSFSNEMTTRLIARG